MKKIFLLIFILFFSFSFIAIAKNSLADACQCRHIQLDVPCSQCEESCRGAGDVRDSCEAGESSSGGGTESVPLNNPLPGGNNPDVNQIIGKAINGVLGIVGSLALVMVIYGGLTWMLAAGNQTRVQKGRDILIWAVVGLVVIFSAYAMVRFVFVNLFGAAG